MSNDQIWNKIYTWRNKYNDYASDYWTLNSVKGKLSESISGINMLNTNQYENVKEKLEDALGDQSDLKNNLKLTKSNFNQNAQEIYNEIQRAIDILIEAMEIAQQKIDYYYGLLD